MSHETIPPSNCKHSLLQRGNSAMFHEDFNFCLTVTPQKYLQVIVILMPTHYTILFTILLEDWFVLVFSPQTSNWPFSATSLSAKNLVSHFKENKIRLEFPQVPPASSLQATSFLSFTAFTNAKLKTPLVFCMWYTALHRIQFVLKAPGWPG